MAQSSEADRRSGMHASTVGAEDVEVEPALGSSTKVTQAKGGTIPRPSRWGALCRVGGEAGCQGRRRGGPSPVPAVPSPGGGVGEPAPRCLVLTLTAPALLLAGKKRGRSASGRCCGMLRCAGLAHRGSSAAPVARLGLPPLLFPLSPAPPCRTVSFPPHAWKHTWGAATPPAPDASPAGRGSTPCCG